eukprot:Nk52_evm3s260 gene=Nk52_evmTU3s260
MKKGKARRESSASTSPPPPLPLKQERYLIFVLHGIGEQIYKSPNLQDHINNLHGRYADLVPGKFRELSNVNIDFVPIEWHSGLHASEKAATLKRLTLKSVPVFRRFCNETSGDIMWYFCNSTYIVNSVVKLMNDAFESYCKQHLGFIKTNVSLIAHSLGGAIIYDILNKIRRVPNGMEIHAIHRTNKFPELSFSPQHCFIFGSPAGAVQVMSEHPFVFPKNRSGNVIKLHNIFHPYDPIAYRIEPYINEEFTNIEPVLLPSALETKTLLSFPSLGFKYSLPSLALSFPESFTSYLPSFQLQLPSNPLKRKVSDEDSSDKEKSGIVNTNAGNNGNDKNGKNDGSNDGDDAADAPMGTRSGTAAPYAKRKRLKGKRSTAKASTATSVSVPSSSSRGNSPTKNSSYAGNRSFTSSPIGLNDKVARHVKSAKRMLKKHLSGTDTGEAAVQSGDGGEDSEECGDQTGVSKPSGKGTPAAGEEREGKETLHPTDMVAKAVKDFQNSLQKALGGVNSSSFPSIGGTDLIATHVYETRAMIAKYYRGQMRAGTESIPIVDTAEASHITGDKAEDKPPNKRRKVESSERLTTEPEIMRSSMHLKMREGTQKDSQNELLSPGPGTPSMQSGGLKRSASAPEVPVLALTDNVSPEGSGGADQKCDTRENLSMDSPEKPSDVVVPELRDDCPTKRLDYVLREQMLEKGSEYLFSVATHGWYWGNRDVMNFILNTLTSDMVTVESRVVDVKDLDSTVMIVRSYLDDPDSEREVINLVTPVKPSITIVDSDI